MVRVLDTGPGRAAGAGALRFLRRVRCRGGEQLGSDDPPHHLTGPRHSILRGGMGTALRPPHRYSTSALTTRALDCVRHPRQHTHHMDGATRALRTTRTPLGPRTPHVCLQFQAHTPRVTASSDQLRYNRLYGFKAARSSPRAQARPPAGPALLPPSRSSPAGARAARTAISQLNRGSLLLTENRSAPPTTSTSAAPRSHGWHHPHGVHGNGPILQDPVRRMQHVLR